MNRVPIEFKPYDKKDPLTDEVRFAGYDCRLYLLIVYDEKEYSSFKVYSFTSESDLLDNFAFCLESGCQCRVSSIRFPVTQYSMPDMFKRISDYVSCSSND